MLKTLALCSAVVAHPCIAACMARDFFAFLHTGEILQYFQDCFMVFLVGGCSARPPRPPLSLSIRQAFLAEGITLVKDIKAQHQACISPESAGFSITFSSGLSAGNNKAECSRFSLPGRSWQDDKFSWKGKLASRTVKYRPSGPEKVQSLSLQTFPLLHFA